VLEVKILPKNKAQAIIPDDQLSLAIGKEGQNVRLAAKLTGWKIDVRSVEQVEQELKDIKAGKKVASDDEEEVKEEKPRPKDEAPASSEVRPSGRRPEGAAAKEDKKETKEKKEEKPKKEKKATKKAAKKAEKEEKEEKKEEPVPSEAEVKEE